jgi:predicted permease
MPIAVTSYLLAEKYGADANAVAGLVVVSTLLTVGISPILIAFLIA